MDVDTVGAMNTDHIRHPEFRLGHPGALIAALPAVLGFVPEHSLVLVALEDGGQMGAVMRVDLSDGLADNIDHLAEVAAGAGAERIVAVVVDADGALCPMCTDEHRRLRGALDDALAERGVELFASHLVDRVAAGARWTCLDGCGAGGVVDDPDASPLAAAAVLDGRRLYARRSDLQAVIDPDDSTDRAALLELIRERAEQRDRQWQADPNGCARRDVEYALAAIAGVADGTGVAEGATLAEVDAAALAVSLCDVAVRDILYALAVGAHAAAAETLWGMLARSLPDPWRVEPLVLLAFSAYARGDGPLAGVSLGAALKIDPDHRMAGMLDTALQSGMRPEQIRELAGTGYRLANRLGVTMPPRRSLRRRAV